MKYWNKQKEYRKTWTKIVGPSGVHDWFRWCQQHESNGKFYVDAFFSAGVRISDFSPQRVTYTDWYFEYPNDATLFLLSYS
jgi:hypothetical protein